MKHRVKFLKYKISKAEGNF